MNQKAISAFAMCACSLLLFAPRAAYAGPIEDAGKFPFVVPWSGFELQAGGVTDVSFLNSTPAGKNGFIVVRDGHFVEAGTGKRIRFLATNFAAKAAFPSHADADAVALRLARLGINLVRMHHMDNVDWGQDASIWDYAFKDRQHISAVQLERLDYLISAFKKNGIYVNLNLHVSRQFSEADGFPRSVQQITFGFDKRVDEFEPRMITLQKQYASQLLKHVNPYTGLAYCVDPAIAVVEINNENSLVGDPWANYGADLDTLPEPFRSELVAQWNHWLTSRYGNDEGLKRAWLAGVTPVGPGLLSATSHWTDEHQGDAGATLHVLDAADQSSPVSALPIHVHVDKTDGTDWHIQVHQTGLNLTEGATYTVSFEAKAESERNLPVNCGLDTADWHNIGLNVSAHLGTDWHKFQYTFTARNILAAHSRIALVPGGSVGSVWISNLQIHPGVSGAGLTSGQSLVMGNVDIPVSALKAQQDDWLRFLADTEQRYAAEMRAYLKDELGVRANIICSQISWGGATGFGREAEMDFADNHAYWQHPSFPHKPWDSEDWYIDNTPMVADLAAGRGGTFRGLAAYRVDGKPYTVSEYNHPAPNDYRAETTPLLATFAALQDWDAIYLFDYGDYGTGVANDRINGYFGISSDPAKTAFLPAAAMIFRNGGIAALPSTTLVVPTKSLTNPSVSFWPAGTMDSLFTAAFTVKVSPEAGASTHVRRQGANIDRPFVTRIENTKGSKPAYISDGSRAVCLVGYIGGNEFHLGGCSFRFAEFGNGFAAVTLTAMDSKPLAVSRHLLLTMVGKVENQGIVWNSKRTSIGSNWGKGPTVAEAIPVELTFASAGIKVWALDGSGKRAGAVPVEALNGSSSVRVGAQYRTLWYEISR